MGILHIRKQIRLRMKVWTDPKTGQRYLMALAVGPPIQPVRPSQRITAYAMSDGGNQLLTLTTAEWNALPFFSASSRLYSSITRWWW
jgi:hypothetical protein